MASPNLGRDLYEASWLESIGPVGRGAGMTLCRRSLELAPNLLVSSRVRINITLLEAHMKQVSVNT
jgi:hypothetical protein